MASRVRRVLMVNRPNALDVPGGDTVQMLATKAALERLGIEVDVSLDLDPDGIGRYEALHLFNLQLPDIQLRQVRSLRAAGVPIALSTIYWDHKEFDWSRQVIRGAYAASPGDRAKILDALARRDIAVNGLRPDTPIAGSDRYLEGQRQVIRLVDLLLPNSHAEATNLFQSLGLDPLPYKVVPNGIDVERFRDADPEPFRSRFGPLYGNRDFVLVAARWDDRKNLALLAEALRDTGLPLVLAGSRPFPDYEAIVRPLLPADTLVLDHLDHAMLASAYAAARVHALPSWFDTPGLSSLEAALAGCSIVVGNRAAESEYFGDQAYYCDPASIESIRQAVLTAWDDHSTNKDRREALRQRILVEYTWDKAAQATLAAYEALQKNRGPILPRANVIVRVSGALPTPSRAAGQPTRRFAASIVIPCWNRVDMTARCVEALAAHTPEELDYELIFVDNGSTDATPELLADLEGDVRVIRNQTNLGFAKACNQGAAAARGEVIVFLNNDTVPQPGWLEPLLETIRKVPRVGAAGSKLVLPDNRIQHAGVIVGKDTQALHWLYHEENPDPAIVGQERDLQVVTAACMAVPKAVFEQVGGFDEAYRNGYEDVDLCFKIRKAGYRVRIVPRSVLVHEESASAGRFDHQDANAELCAKRWNGRILPDIDRFEALAKGRKPEFSVVVVSYNSESTLAPCMRSVLATLGPDDELIVIDNASSDRSGAIAREFAGGDSRVWVYESAENLGFSKGVNRGLQASEGEYLVLLNPDTLVTAGWLGRMRDHFRGDPFASRIGAVGPVSNWVAGKQHMSEYLAPEKTNGLNADAVSRLLLAGGAQGIETKLLIGFCMMLPRSVLEEVGTLDEDLFLGMDDLDLSWRLRLAGYSLAIATNTFVFHHGQVSFKTEPASRSKRLTREATNAFARKLEGHYGRGQVPSSMELWGVDWMKPDVDIWGPKPTRFRAVSGSWEPVLEAYVTAFEQADPVILELTPAEAIAGPGMNAEATVPAEATAPESRALEGLAAQVGQWLESRGHDPEHIPDVEIVPLAVPTEGRVIVGPDAPDEVPHIRAVAPHILREACGYRPAPLAKDLVSIVILTRNGLDVTVECLASIELHTHEPYELIMVDNGSTDQTRKFLQGFARSHSNVTLVYNDDNLGFAAGCNQGMAAARGEHILLLNNDVVVTDGWLTRLLRPLHQDPAIGIVGPRTNRVASKQLVPDSDYENLDQMQEFARDWSRKRAGRGHFDELAIGFALLIRGEVFRQIGGLDLRFGTGNYEDDDYCLRAQLAGWKIWIADDCFIHHYGSQTFKTEQGAGKIDYDDLISGNREIYFDKWMIRVPTGRPGLASVLKAFSDQGRTYSPEQLWGPLPAARELPIAATTVGIEGAKAANLLVWPDWDDPSWQDVVRSFSQAFDATSPVALVLPAPPLQALEQMAALLDAHDSPDALVVPEACWAADLVATTQGVVLAGHSRDAELRHLAGLLGKPVLDRPDQAGLREWASQVVAEDGVYAGLR